MKFYLDYKEQKLGIIITPVMYKEKKTMLPIGIEEISDQFHKEFGTDSDNTLIVSVRRTIGTIEINAILNNLIDNNMRVVIFATDTIERAEQILKQMKENFKIYIEQ